MTLFSLFLKLDPFSSMPGQQTTQFNISSIHGNLNQHFSISIRFTGKVEKSKKKQTTNLLFYTTT
jgi:hypothetical protein